MSLMVSVSGIRGIVGEDLTPDALLVYVTAYAKWLKSKNPSPKIVIGRDTRPTGTAIVKFVKSSLVQFGCNVVYVGVCPTPTVGIAVKQESASGGIVVTASHNPIAWNALKLLNDAGEVLSQEEMNQVLAYATKNDKQSASWHNFGISVDVDGYVEKHIRAILDLSYIDVDLISSLNLKVLVDAVNGAGSESVPLLCERLGIRKVFKVACKPTGLFPRNPEPIEENLVETSGLVSYYQADLGIVVDPDVDRVCFICENGEPYGEEYTLVTCADFFLSKNKGPVVNNLSSSRALRDIAEKHQVPLYSSKVGEANVIALMKAKNAVIGGEGSGGVIIPEIHFGRDALASIAIFLQAYASWKRTKQGEDSLSEFKKEYPTYYTSKKKVVSLDKKKMSVKLEELARKFQRENLSREDGLKIDFKQAWVHIRQSNTEPMVRIYTEAKTQQEASKLASSMAKLVLT